MIPLSVQIPSLLISFIYGIVIYYVISFFYCFICCKKVVLRFALSFLLILLLGLIYFLILLRVNNGIIHIYFYLFLLGGYIMVFVLRNY